MYQKVNAYVKEHQMLIEQDKVIVGVSGGADSICLLFMLLEMKKEMDFSLVAVHINHGLRGDDAMKDEKYVQKVCTENKVELVVFRENVKEYARKQGYTEEEAGREIRRQRFQQVLQEKKGTKIALAHHKNDNVETFLWNLCRGTGLKGMGGISPVTGMWIRPLLCVSREDIENYLEQKGIGYCTDKTNYEDHYTRNKIRNHVIPYLEEHVNAQSVNHMAETIENIRLLSEYIDAEVEKYKSSCVSRNAEKYILMKDEFEKIPQVFQTKVIHSLLTDIAGRKRDVESVHVEAVINLLGRQVGRQYDFPYQIKALRVYEGIEFSNQQENKEKEQMPKVQMKVFERTPEMVTFPEKTYTKWFDYDIIKRTVEIRHRESGDYIVINKDGKKQKLKQYFINEKIPQKERDQIWLVADGKQIMWVVGYRQSQAYQITDQTKRILEIRFM